MTASNRLIPTGQNPDVVSTTVLVDGKEIPKKYHLASIALHTELNKIPTATLVLLDGEPDKEAFSISDDGDFLPGKKMEIKLGYHNEKNTVFKGIIITNTHRIDAQCAELNIECKDETVKMTVNKGNRHFNDVADSDVVSQLLDDNKIPGADVETLATKHEQLVQSNVSDWDFMMSRLDVNGMICVIDNGAVKVRKPKLDEEAKLELTYGANILEFHADMDARTQTASVKTRSWDFQNQKVLTTESEDQNVPEEGSFTRTSLASVTNQPLEMRTSATLSQPETQAIANAKKLRQDLSKIKARVKYQGIHKALPGDFVMLKGVGKNFSGKAFVSAIQHEYADGDWVTEATLGWNEQFFAEETSPQHSASGTGQSSSLHGLQTGIVTGITDANGQYRVKIRLPMVNDQDDGIYARVATLDAGDKRGTFFRPEVNDEVVVGFMNDDPRSPIILGMLHSSAKTSPLEPASANPEKGYVSRTGIKLIFNDDQKSLRIETPGSRVFEMNDSDGSITLKDGNGNKLVMDQSGITLESMAALTLKAGTTLSIGAPQLSLKADGSMSVEGTGSASIGSSGITEIKGSLVKIN
ncbi:type VI secretion system tip protein VgrG [Chryseolinea lacunae]|uniref:Type VI secretion system tip protein VgrG n=1 Tax=Chryseolinea lacunae TaxID=2801331 RepID=A0ABS1KNT1_9BACT|nr:type VI secretion system tip protein VgrG [Chryseolinea lacunae]MBL0741130.1 type VI secretion system tip protein VgrG [Chryseolinea lacunae]